MNPSHWKSPSGTLKIVVFYFEENVSNSNLKTQPGVNSENIHYYSRLVFFDHVILNKLFLGIFLRNQ
jgi:hypothetical protein